MHDLIEDTVRLFRSDSEITVEEEPEPEIIPTEPEVIDEKIADARRALRGELIHGLERDKNRGVLHESSPVRSVPPDPEADRQRRRAPPGAMTPGGDVDMIDAHRTAIHNAKTMHDPIASVYTGHRSANPTLQGVMAEARNDLHLEEGGAYRQTPIRIEEAGYDGMYEPSLEHVMESMDAARPIHDEVNPSQVPSFYDLLEAANVHCYRPESLSLMNRRLRDALQAQAWLAQNEAAAEHGLEDRAGMAAHGPSLARARTPDEEAAPLERGKATLGEAVQAACGAARDANPPPRRRRYAPAKLDPRAEANNLFSDF